MTKISESFRRDTSRIESHRHAVRSLDGKAGTILTAGTIVFGMAMGGMGTVVRLEAG